MTADNEHLWQSNRPWISAGRVALLIAIAPIIILASLVSVLLVVITWPVRKLFPPGPLSAAELVAELDAMLGGDTDYEIDYELQVITRCDFDDERLAELKRRVVVLGAPPWTSSIIDELKAIRDSAQAIAAGDAA